MWKHPNLRIAYVAQHAFHHIEEVQAASSTWLAVTCSWFCESCVLCKRRQCPLMEGQTSEQAADATPSLHSSVVKGLRPAQG